MGGLLALRLSANFVACFPSTFLAFIWTCLLTSSFPSCVNNMKLSHFIPDIMDYFLAGEASNKF